MKLGKLATFLMVIISFLPAQLEKVEHKPNPTKMVDFGDLAEGPYQKLVIRNVMVIPGHGGPANGPFDILVTGNVIAKIQRHDPKKPDRMKGDRIIEGDNLFVMPGMLNLHLHLRNESLPLDYIFYLILSSFKNLQLFSKLRYISQNVSFYYRYNTHCVLALLLRF